MRRSYRRQKSRATEINMAPLIDMVFILLIFFLVTTSFVKEAGVDVRRPSAETAQEKKDAGLFVGVDAEGQVFMERQNIDVRMVRPRVERFLAENPGSSVVVVADKDSRTGIVVEVIDQCRLAGVVDVGIAARRTSE